MKKLARDGDKVSRRSLNDLRLQLIPIHNSKSVTRGTLCHLEVSVCPNAQMAVVADTPHPLLDGPLVQVQTSIGPRQEDLPCITILHRLRRLRDPFSWNTGAIPAMPRAQLNSITLRITQVDRLLHRVTLQEHHPHDIKLVLVISFLEVHV